MEETVPEETPAGSLSTSDLGFRLQSLMEFVSLMTAARGYGELLRVMAVESRRALEASTVSLSIWERDRGVMRTLVNEGDLGPFETPTPVDEVYGLADHPLARRMFTEGVGYVQILGEPGGDPRVERILADEEKHSCLAMPIMFEGRVWGELWATRSAALTPYTEADLDFGRLVAAQVGAGVAQAEHLKRVERLAYTDDLTGLANRRAFEDRLDDALAQHRSEGLPVGIIVVDVNGLKRINDQLGHLAGDTSLVTFAAELAAAASIVPGTLASRLAGDEFCLLTSGISGDAVVALADDVCRRASDVLDDGVACGVATTDHLSAVGVTPSRLLRAADAAQYRSKRMVTPRPVVAGRTQAMAGLVGDVDDDDGERRRFRGRGSLDPGQLLDELVERLDAGVDRDPLPRLRIVAEAVAANVDAASWWISATDESGGSILTLDSNITRRSEAGDDEFYGPVSYPVDAFPATYAALSGRSVVVDVDDPRSDPAEVSLLMTAGLAEMVMSGGPDLAGRSWVIEVMGDELSAPMRVYASVLRAGVALALRP